MQIDKALGNFAVDLDHIEQLKGVIGTVPQVGPQLFADMRHVVAHQGVDRLAQRPKRMAQIQQFTFQKVDLADHAVLRFGQDMFFEAFGDIAVTLDDRKIAVDRQVDQRIGQIAGRFADMGAAIVQALSHRRKTFAALLAHTQHNVVAQNDRQLIRIEGRSADGHPQGDLDVIRRDFGFRPLVGMEQVGDRQRMQVEFGADVADPVLIFQSADVDPAQTVGGFAKSIGVLHFGDRVGAVFQQSDPGVGGVVRRDDQRRRGPDVGTPRFSAPASRKTGAQSPRADVCSFQRGLLVKRGGHSRQLSGISAVWSMSRRFGPGVRMRAWRFRSNTTCSKPSRNSSTTTVSKYLSPVRT